MKTINEFFDNSKFVEAEFSDARNIVFAKSLALEKYMSMFLAFILDIDNYKNSKSFGNTSNALSFNQKLNLFTDLEFIIKEDKNKLIAFSEIRNQFAHNAECLTFADAFTQEIHNRLKRTNPNLSKSTLTEEDYKKAFEDLFIDIKLMFEKLRHEVYNKKINEFLTESMYVIYQTTIENIRKHPKYFNLEAYNHIVEEVIKLTSEKYGWSNDKLRTDVKVNFGKYFKD